MFTNTYLPHVGGVAHSVSSYENELRSRGHQIQVIAPEYKGAEESTDQVLRVPAIQNFNGSDFSVRLPEPWLISDFIDTVQPELIHSHHPFLLGDAALRTAYERGLPLVFTHHTMYEQYTHYVPLDSDAMRRVAVQMATEYCNLCHCVIAPSESIRQLLEKRGVTVRIEAIPTGIDLDFFGSGDGPGFRRELNIPEEAVLIGHVGRLAAEKNLGFLASAVGLFLSRHPDARFVVVGDGADKDSMQQTLVDQGVGEQVVFAGRRTGKELVDAYAAMDVFAFASQSETQGMVIAEAMAAATPVVALDGPGVREIVEEKNGRLLDAKATEAEFAETLESLTIESELLWRLGDQARTSIRPCGLVACADRLEKLYEALVDESRKAHPNGLDSWEQLQGRMEAEWRLIVEKASALAAAVAETQATSAAIS